MAKLQSRFSAKQPIAPWKQLHHWQGLGLVLLMFPLGSSLIMGTAALEQANRQGLPEAGWAADWSNEIAQTFSSSRLSAIATTPSSEPNQNFRPTSLRSRQRRAIKSEIDNFTGQAHESLDNAIANALPQAQATPDSISVLDHSLAPDLRHSPTGLNPEPLQYPPATVEQFLAIALGTEFTPSHQAMSLPHIRKWVQDVRIQVHGNPTPKDIATLEQVVAEINQLLGEIELGFVESDANLDVFFVPERDFSRHEASYQPVNHGYFWNEAHQGAIQRGKILISTTDITQAERSHLIREELTQSLGLMQDSLTDASSIFYQGWSQTQAYSPEDQQLLRMLYRPDIYPGMDGVAVEQVLLGS